MASGQVSATNRVEIVLQSPTVAIVSLVGEHDLAQSAPLKEALETAVTRRRNVLVDLSDCVFLDSTVISLLLHTQDEVVSNGGRFALIVPDGSTHTARVLDVMHLGDALPIHRSLDEALGSVEHRVRIRNLGERPGDSYAFGAECSCGWQGGPHKGVLAMRHAHADASSHSAESYT
jgi:anti-anti-sigma factor